MEGKSGNAGIIPNAIAEIAKRKNGKSLSITYLEIQSKDVVIDLLKKEKKSSGIFENKGKQIYNPELKVMHIENEHNIVEVFFYKII
jgi:hypothetical protein